LLGYSAVEMLGRLPEEFLPAEERSRFRESHRDRLALSAVQVELHWIKKDGGSLPTIAAISNIYDESGAYAGALAMLTDITKRTCAEAQARTSVQRLEALRALDTAILEARSREEVASISLRFLDEFVPIWAVNILSFDFDADEGEVLDTVRSPSPEFSPGLRISFDDFGRDDIAVLLTGAERVVPDVDALPVLSKALHSLRAKGMRSYARIPLMAEGSLIGSLNMGSDKLGGFEPSQIAIARSISDVLAIGLRQSALRDQVARQAAELEQRVAERTAQLEAVNRELESFTASVSHDLRAPARHIDGYASLLLEEAGELKPDTIGTLQRIVRAAKRMNTLIDDLLSLARTGTQELNKSDFDMQALVKEVVEEIDPRSSASRICWKIDALPPAHGDPALVRVMLQNLLANAVKYSSKREQAKIEVGARKSESGAAEFFVHDNGAGFDMAYSDKLFCVFSRLHSEREFEGTGIGLATVQRIVNRHGGRIRAHGKPGEGAEFSFTLT
jgi:PAS domain S-box-containing protein